MVIFLFYKIYSLWFDPLITTEQNQRTHILKQLFSCYSLRNHVLNFKSDKLQLFIFFLARALHFEKYVSSTKFRLRVFSSNHEIKQDPSTNTTTL